MSIRRILRRAERGPSVPPPAALFFAALLAAALLPPPSVFAHRLYVFARSENGQVCGKSYFSKKSMAADALFTVSDERGAVLLQGRTDEAGRFCFTRPGEAGLTIAVSAGQGHRGEFTLAAEKSAAAGSVVPVPSSPVPAVHKTPFEEQRGVPQPPAAASSVPPEAAVHKEMLQSAIREELQRSLPPLLERSLAGFSAVNAARPEERESGPDLRDIVGGLGWIAGLAALAVFYRSRRAS